ncbi:MAG: transposase [Bdellovibrionales bacterium]|nr:transposase [Bdellovibrionales bacterium]
MDDKKQRRSRLGRQLSLHTQLPIGSQQRSNLKSRLYPRTTHGGDPARGKRKTERPFSAKTPIHLVLKSRRAKSQWSLLHRRHRSKITSMIYVYAQRFSVEVYRASNTGNHLHLLVRAKERKNLADYLRVLAGRIAVTVTGAQKAVKRVGKFWDNLYWSRLVNWGRDFFQVREYLIANLTIEAMQLATEMGTPADLAALGNIWEPDE